MRPNPAEAPRGPITELRAALDAIPADEPRNYLRQSLQVLVPLLEQMHQRLLALEARLNALDSGHRRPGGTLPPAPSGGTRLQKHLLTVQPLASGPQSGAKEIAAIAAVWVTWRRLRPRSIRCLISTAAQGAVAGSPPDRGNSG
jgi:alkanesulfonate monooxygenase SsuD/methylene tetrahydromethanopterin reductase-like flavin-dependent oxidoreductase (luciferase family)